MRRVALHRRAAGWQRGQPRGRTSRIGANATNARWFSRQSDYRGRKLCRHAALRPGRQIQSRCRAAAEDGEKSIIIAVATDLVYDQRLRRASSIVREIVVIVVTPAVDISTATRACVSHPTCVPATVKGEKRAGCQRLQRLTLSR